MKLSFAPSRLLASVAALLAFAATGHAAAALPKPPTPAEQNLWKQQGRTLPVLESHQPVLDPALPAYVPRRDLELSGHFKGAASDVLAALTQQWIAAFRKYYPKVELDVPPPYAGSLGALELIKGDLQFVMVSRELKPTDIAGFAEKFGYPPFSAPVSGGTYRHFGFLDAIGFFVHPDNPLRQLTFDQIDAIYSRTHHRGGAPITTWGQLGLTGEWAACPIVPVATPDYSTPALVFQHRVLQDGLWAPGVWTASTPAAALQQIAATPGAIAFAGFLPAPGAKTLALAETDAGPFVTGSDATVANHTYPLTRNLYLAVNQRPGAPLPQKTKEFLAFVLSREGQQIVADYKYFYPLNAADAAQERAKLVGYLTPVDPAIPAYRPRATVSGPIANVGSDGMETDLAPMGRELWPGEKVIYQAVRGQPAPLEIRVARGGFNTPQRTTAQAVFHS